MKVTEHNVDADWNFEEVDALMKLVKGEISDKNDKQTQFFYAKIYGKLMGLKHDLL
jgi:hypothetical protein